MTATKVLVIVLILIAVLFVVLAVWGAGNNGPRPKADSPPPSNFNADSYPLIGSLGSFFGSSSPKLTANELTPDPPPIRRAHGLAEPAGKFVLSMGDQPTRFDVPADSKDKFRKATFSVLKQGCADIEYETADGSGGKLRDQKWTSTVEPHPKDPTKAEFQIPSAKGSLTITFHSPGCTVQLE